MKIFGSLAPLILSLTLASAAAGQMAEDITVRGYVSQGYLNTSEHEYLVTRSRDGSAEMMEAAITMTAEPTERLRVGVQFLARNFGDLGNDRASVDWAFLDYRWRDELGVRAGKVKLPLGFYNEVRDLDFLRTSVLLPQSVYPEDLRDFLTAYEGVGGYGSLEAHAWGQFDYHVYGGTLNVAEPDRGFWKNNFEREGEAAETQVAKLAEEAYGLAPGEAEASFVHIVDPSVTVPYVWGGALAWTTPLEGLRLGTSYMGGRFRYEGRFRYDVNLNAPGDSGFTASTVDVDETWDIKRMATYSLEYTRDDLMLTAEYYDQKFEVERPSGWYVGGDWRARDRISLGAYYSCYWEDVHDKSGARMKAKGLPDHYGWQKSLVLGARYDLTDRWLVKFEYHFMDGVAQTRQRTLRREVADPVKRHWGMLTARTTVHF